MAPSQPGTGPLTSVAVLGGISLGGRLRARTLRPHHSAKPPTSEEPAGRGLDQSALPGYFFLPWFLTASMAAAAASGSRYLPPGVTGLKSASSS
jgi:hypothetical protein